jgi:hypothetical protein
VDYVKEVFPPRPVRHPLDDFEEYELNAAKELDWFDHRKKFSGAHLSAM